MNELNNHPAFPAEQSEPKQETIATPVNKKPFVEPSVSVPVDVLEATAFFQGETTVETADV